MSIKDENGHMFSEEVVRTYRSFVHWYVTHYDEYPTATQYINYCILYNNREIEALDNNPT